MKLILNKEIFNKNKTESFFVDSIENLLSKPDIL